VEWVVPALDAVEVGRIGTVGAGAVAPVVGLVDEAEAAEYAAEPIPPADSSSCRVVSLKPALGAIRMIFGRA
jgi:hypothetical protein